MPINPDYDKKVSQTNREVNPTTEQLQGYVESYKKQPLFSVKSIDPEKAERMYSTPTAASDSIKIANNYIGRVNSDRVGNKLFSNGANRQWCADFASYVINQAYHGLLVGFPTGVTSVNAIRDWGIKEKVYKTIPKTNKVDFIKSNVKPGDLVIEKNGKSHVGIVDKVYPDGSYDVTAGNTADSVKTLRYKPGQASVSGFVLLSEYMKKNYGTINS